MTLHHPKVLFILKRRQDYSADFHSGKGMSTGLMNSSSFVDSALRESGFDSRIEVVIDNNDIDRVVTLHRPSHVIIEALWVVPEKFTELTKLHPSVKWIIRLHSDAPFLAMEGIAFKWLGHYLTNKNVIVSANSPRMFNELKIFSENVLRCKNRAIYLPNTYPHENFEKTVEHEDSGVLNVGCFGAIRPLKNTLIQALGAMDAANNLGKKLHFHINARIERGDSIMDNLKGLFTHTLDAGHQLVCHPWKPHDEFVKLCKGMHVGMQVSFSETFNIVAADLVSAGVPVIGTDEIPWIESTYVANPTRVDDISRVLMEAVRTKYHNVQTHQHNIKKYSEDALHGHWIEFLHS